MEAPVAVKTALSPTQIVLFPRSAIVGVGVTAMNIHAVSETQPGADAITLYDVDETGVAIGFGSVLLFKDTEGDHIYFITPPPFPAIVVIAFKETLSPVQMESVLALGVIVIVHDFTV